MAGRKKYPISNVPFPRSKFSTLGLNQDLQDERILRMKASLENPGNSEILKILLQKRERGGV